MIVMQLKILGGGSLLQGEYRKEGMQNFLVLPCEKNVTEGYESMLMQYHTVPYMIPYEVREVNGICEIYYRLQYRTTLQAVMGHLPLNMSRLFHMFDSIVGVLEMAEEYMFDEESILWNPEFIFIEADTGRLSFCSYPDNRDFHYSLKQLLTEFIQRADKKDDTAVMYILQFYNLVTEPDCSLAALRNYIMKYSENRMPDQENRIYEEDGIRQLSSFNIEEQKGKDVFLYEKDKRIGKGSVGKTEESVQREVACNVEKKICDREEKGKKKEKAEKSQCESPHEGDEQMGEKIIKWMLVITALFNLGLIAMLLFDVLTYDYVKYLLGSMGAMIVLTIIYMNISKEETPDEMMQAYFEEHTIPPADRVQSRLAYAGVSDGYPMSGQPEEQSLVDNRKENRSNFPSGCKLTQQYGETTLLTAEDNSGDVRSIIVKEEYETSLFLASFVQGKYKPIHIENSIIVGCMEEGCTYLLKQRGISRMHAKLMKKPDGLYLLDLNSTNGTFLNGEAVVSGEEYKLDEGDVVAFAQCEFYVASEQ